MVSDIHDRFMSSMFSQMYFNNNSQQQSKEIVTEKSNRKRPSLSNSGNSNIDNNERKKLKQYNKPVGKENINPNSQRGRNSRRSSFPFASSKYSLLKKPFQQLSLAFGGSTPSTSSNTSSSNTNSNTASQTNSHHDSSSTNSTIFSGLTNNQFSHSDARDGPSRLGLDNSKSNSIPPLAPKNVVLSVEQGEISSKNFQTQIYAANNCNSRSNSFEECSDFFTENGLPKYLNDIGFEYWYQNMECMFVKECDTNYQVSFSDIISKQREITMDMRSIVVDWLIEVCGEYRLAEETLYFAISLIDRALCEMNVIRSELQLLGVTCIMIASKWYEISPPSMEEWVYICDDQYSSQNIIRMESTVLKLLKFQIVCVTPYHFLRAWIKILQKYNKIANSNNSTNNNTNNNNENKPNCNNTSAMSTTPTTSAMSISTISTFMSINSKHNHIMNNNNNNTCTLAFNRQHMSCLQYIIDQSAVNGQFYCSVKPSKLVASAIFLVQLYFNNEFNLSHTLFKQITSYDHPFLPKMSQNNNNNDNSTKLEIEQNSLYSSDSQHRNRNRNRNTILEIAHRIHNILLLYSKKIECYKNNLSNSKHSNKHSSKNKNILLTPAIYDKYSRSKYHRIAHFPFEKSWHKLLTDNNVSSN